ncbi:hypothetical protein HYD99_01885 [Mycoplasmopsis bovis]|nr:hypothetical protein [Mycoplasmopsis bovis]QQH28949.1 hypothetical protein HYD99_01885 [Mycoplasmopsis bovis]
MAHAFKHYKLTKNLGLKSRTQLGGQNIWKETKIKKLSVLTFSSLSVVSTFAIISASCEPIEKVDAPQVVGIESSAPLSNSDVTKPRLLLIKKEKTDNKSVRFKKSFINILKSLLPPPLLIWNSKYRPKNFLKDSFDDC